VGVKKLTTPLTLTLSRGVEREEKKGFNNTLTLILSRKGREGGKVKRIFFTHHFDYFPQRERRDFI
jgi:hypothetical protein